MATGGRSALNRADGNIEEGSVKLAEFVPGFVGKKPTVATEVKHFSEAAHNGPKEQHNLNVRACIHWL